MTSFDTVLMYPAHTGQKDNPFIPILVDALAQTGVRCESFNIYHPVQSAGVFHVHWPERVFQNRLGSRSSYAARAFAENLIRTAERVRRRGGRVVWTAHNLAPHDMPDAGRQRVWHVLRQRFFELVTDVAMLSTDSRAQIVATIPELGECRFHPVLHHHFRGFFGPYQSGNFRAELGIGADDKVFSAVGYIKRYKRVAEMITAFRDSDLPKSHLVIAGRIEGPYKADIAAARADDRSVHVLDRALSHAELTDIIRASNACLFNPRAQFNSGSLMTALSLGTAAVCPKFSAASEIAKAVGPDWVLEVEDALTPADIALAAERFVGVRRDHVPSLDLFSPRAVAERHLAAYGYG